MEDAHARQLRRTFRQLDPKIVVLDPMDEPLHNAMTATAYQLRNASPMTDTLLAPWFVDMTRNACIRVGALPCYRHAMHDIRRSLLTGRAGRRREPSAAPWPGSR